MHRELTAEEQHALDSKLRKKINAIQTYTSYDSINDVLAKGANINAQDAHGNTPFHYAATREEE